MSPALLALLATLAAHPKPAPPAAPPPIPTVCVEAVAHDDGRPESGYGMVPSSHQAAYVTVLDSAELPSRQLHEVCVCWMRTRTGSDVDFEVVLYADLGGRPAPQPYASIPGHAAGVPKTKETAGQLYAVDVGKVVVPPGRSWIGVQWDPSASQFAFVCVDQTKTTPRVPTFFRDDHNPAWTEVGESHDPIFSAHRALVLRATAWPGPPRPLGRSASGTPALGH